VGDVDGLDDRRDNGPDKGTTTGKESAAPIVSVAMWMALMDAEHSVRTNAVAELIIGGSLASIDRRG
jgi:hypothetical protein